MRRGVAQIHVKYPFDIVPSVVGEFTGIGVEMISILGEEGEIRAFIRGFPYLKYASLVAGAVDVFYQDTIHDVIGFYFRRRGDRSKPN